MGLCLGLPLTVLHNIHDKDSRYHSFYDKCLDMLVAAYFQNGDDFPRKLCKVMNHFSLGGMFQRKLQVRGWDTVFYHCYSDDDGKKEMVEDSHHAIHMLCMELACDVAYHPGADVLFATALGVLPWKYDHEVDIVLKIFFILLAGYVKLPTDVFLARLEIVLDQHLQHYMDLQGIVKQMVFDVPLLKIY